MSGFSGSRFGSSGGGGLQTNYSVIPEGSLNPLTLTFTRTAMQRPVQMIGTLQIAEDWSDVTGFGMGTGWSVASGRLQRTGTNVGINKWAIPLSIPSNAIEFEIKAFHGSGTADALGAGWSVDTSNGVYALYDRVSQKFYITRIKTGLGSVDKFVTSGTVSLSAGARVCVALVSGQLAVYSKDNGHVAWTFQGAGDVSDYGDLTSTGVLSTLSPTLYSLISGTTGTQAFGETKIGTFGQVGIQNMQIVKYEDGTPIIREGRVYFTATAAGVGTGASIIQVLQLGVYSMAIRSPHDVRLEGQIYSTRSNGTIKNDCVGGLVYDRTEREWIALISTWGDSTTSLPQTRLNLYRAKTNLLSGVNVLTSPTALGLPNAGTQSHYDADLTKINGTWYCAYTRTGALTGWTTFFAALASSPDLSTWTFIGEDTSRGNLEGTRIINVGNAWFVACGKQGTREWHIYNMSMVRQGNLADAAVPAVGLCPHPAIFPIPANNGGTEYLAICHDNNKLAGGSADWSHGNAYILDAAQTSTGRKAGFETITP